MKFYEFKNLTKDSAELYIYGEIVQENQIDWWTGEKSETAVDLVGFKKELDDIGNVNTLNMYINSPGGDVFVASTMISMLQRLKDKGTTINAYVDGLSASAASFLMFVADNINLYSNSIVMIHKPMSIAMGNSDDFQSMIDTLNKIEDSILVPMYMKKAVDGVDEAQIKQLLADETWLGATDMIKYFNVNILEDTKQIAACIDKKLFKNYKNIPKELIEETKENVISNIKVDVNGIIINGVNVTEILETKNKEITDKARAKLKLQATL
jgi:ATP-dependent protease ClpP protease subunit